MKRKLNYLAIATVVAVFVFGSSTTRARVVFFDGFEYAVNRTAPDVVQLFQSHGWSFAKTHPSGQANGYLSTVTSIPGYSGPFPGTNSSRVLLLEALPGSLGGQTDFYLQYGGSAQPANTIPGDVWIQFWMYPQYYGNQLSRYGTRNKFLYVCNTDYPCHSHLWMVSQGAQTYDRVNAFPRGNPSQGDFFWNTSSASGVSQIINTRGDEYTQDTMGQSNTTEWMRANRWTLVKMRFNTTRTSGNSWETWLRPMGGSWTKVADWVGGTPGFTWNVPSESVGGHRVLRMPTTVGGVTSQLYDYWLYMDDFVLATTEADLPVYADAGTGTAPGAPTNVRILRAAMNLLGFESPAERARNALP